MSKAALIKSQFQRYHADNAWVYDYFNKFTYELIASGFSRHSAYAVMHRVRWEVATKIRGKGKFKINNNYIPYYARMWMQQHPQHSTFFEVRELITENR